MDISAGISVAATRLVRDQETVGPTPTSPTLQDKSSFRTTLPAAPAARHHSVFRSKKVRTAFSNCELRLAGEPAFSITREELNVLNRKLAHWHNYGDPDEAVRALYLANVASKLRIE